MGKFRNFLTRLRDNRSGNALIMVATGMPVLIGSAGFAIDTAQWYMWKRELQYAVDQAAYAGAFARSNPDVANTYQSRAQQEYDANVDKVDSFDTVPQIRLADYAGGTDNSVVVTSTASKRLPFSSFITNGTVATIRVTAQASFAAGGQYNACVISLREDGTGTAIGGSATVNAQCGLAALSCDDNAIVIDGSATVNTDSIAACGTIDAANNEAVSTEGVQGLFDAYKELTPPDDPTPQTYKCSGKGKNKQASLQPGTYSDLTVQCRTTLATGVYVIDGGTLDLAANYDVTGTRVMFVLKNGATIKLGGNGNGNSINLTPMQSGDFAGTPYASQADELSDILVFEHRDNNASQVHQFNGNSNSLIEGLIYLPDGDLRVNGTADVAAQCLQISAYTIDVRGGAFLETLCPVEDATEVGNTTADVRLVA
ncbi:TadE/TadG family type IV pilus assembly protein [Erythrobacter ani]|uniref:Pilus assembly protein n=1 Tax=Erythrobacter ani TaxID=2827235 RepID=A0ABS6SPT3_9SPHN|nr:TadE/TadG family type IV pilus assembly protein [Erythrobacter ani]MBV7267027.1 pilus assembly protein [Erythrobacter ani]